MDDFRLAYLLSQVSGQSGLEFSAQQFERIRPINGVRLGGAARKLS